MRILSLQISAIVFMALAIMDCLGNTCKSHDPIEESVVDSISEDHSCNGKHDHHHGSHDHHHHDLDYRHPWEANEIRHNLLQEELAEEEDLRLYARRYEDSHELHNSVHLSGLGLWMQAMGCSLLVSMVSLVCVFILPFIFVQGKPSNTFVDSLAVFGAGAMLGDAFLHQLPHAFGTGNLHTHDNHMEHVAHHHHYVEKHSHSLGDLSVGLSILSGIMVFFLVENIVRYVEDVTGGRIFNGHHHHHHKLGHNFDDTLVPNELHDSCFGENKNDDKTLLRNQKEKYFNKKESDVSTNLVLGYLNLFSDGIHNFTDGVALGNAFMLYGSVGGWSRTLFLLAHELPQEVGDFGILVRSGFSVKKALVFNFMSALAALSGTAMVLVWRGGDRAVSGKSSLIEGFTAGGFVYISIAGVLAGGVNNEGGGKEKKCIWRICVELVVLMLGVGVALSISILE